MNGIRSKGEKITEIIAHAVLILLTLLALAPFWLLVASSLTDNNFLTKFGYNFWPGQFSVAAYQYIAREWAQIGRAYLITIIVTVAGTAASVLLTALAGYALSQKDVPGVKLCYILILFTMLFNGGIVASYITYTNVVNVKNTLWALLIPNLLLNGFNITLARNYMSTTIPGALLEAADIDGAGEFRKFRTIILPLSKPILATVGLLTAVAYWNDWTNGLYYITDSKLYSIQLLLNQMNESVGFLAAHSDLGAAAQNVPGTTMRMAIAVVGILPIIIAYPFFQKYFAKGIMMGAVKG